MRVSVGNIITLHRHSLKVNGFGRVEVPDDASLLGTVMMVRIDRKID